MKTINFVKQCNVRKLHRELLAAGFLVLGVTYDAGKNITTVSLDDAETKDPSAVVSAHIFTADKSVDWQAEYAKAVSPVTQFNVISKRLGFVDLIEMEIETGQLQ